MAKSPKTVPVRVATAFVLTRDDFSKHPYEAGLQDMPVEDAEHPYSQFFLVQGPLPELGDYEFAQAKRAYADKLKGPWEAAEEAAAEAETAWLQKAAQAKAAEEAGQLPATEPAGDAEEDGEEDAAEEGEDGASSGGKRRKRPRL